MKVDSDPGTTHQTCVPVLLYPCRTPSCGAHDVLLFETSWNSHWLIRCRKSNIGLTAFSGGGRVWTHMLMPDWMMARVDLTEQAMVKELLGAFASDKRGTQTWVYIPCEYPVRILMSMANWSGENRYDDLNYDDPEWLLHMDTSTHCSISSRMFCDKFLNKRDFEQCIEEDESLFHFVPCAACSTKQ